MSGIKLPFSSTHSRHATDGPAQGASTVGLPQPRDSGGARKRSTHPLLSRIKDQVRACLPGSAAPRIDSRPRAPIPGVASASEQAANAEMVNDTIRYIKAQQAGPIERTDDVRPSTEIAPQVNSGVPDKGQAPKDAFPRSSPLSAATLSPGREGLRNGSPAAGTSQFTPRKQVRFSEFLETFEPQEPEIYETGVSAAHENLQRAADRVQSRRLKQDASSRQASSGILEKGKAVKDATPPRSSPMRSSATSSPVRERRADGASTSGTKPAGLRYPLQDSDLYGDSILRHITGEPRMGRAGRPQAASAPVPPAAASSPTARPGDGARPVYPKWKGKDRLILASDSDSTSKRSALAQRNYRDVPDKNFVTLASLAAGRTEAADGAAAGPLAQLSLGSRLDLHGHGSQRTFEKMSPDALAQKLYDAGLREVGVLKLQACHVGRSDYLPKLKQAMEARGMRVGYLSGFKGEVIPHTKVLNVFGKSFNFRYTATRKAVRDAREDAYVNEGSGLTVIKGNTDVGFKGTRYNFATARRGGR